MMVNGIFTLHVPNYTIYRETCIEDIMAPSLGHNSSSKLGFYDLNNMNLTPTKNL